MSHTTPIHYCASHRQVQGARCKCPGPHPLTLDDICTHPVRVAGQRVVIVALDGSVVAERVPEPIPLSPAPISTSPIFIMITDPKDCAYLRFMYGDQSQIDDAVRAMVSIYRAEYEEGLNE